jgi:fructose-1,6-bisphosphatase/inositol monophosphatase family enzyme
MDCPYGKRSSHSMNQSPWPAIGVMNQPFTHERFVGTQKGAWCNDQPGEPRPCSSLAAALIIGACIQGMPRTGRERAAAPRYRASDAVTA